MNEPKVSVIIPTYNRAHIISETLDSILNQTYQNWECIIVDDGSNDNTENIINKYLKNDNRFKFYRRPDDRLKGANACRNYGIENSCGTYIMFLDSDDICESFCLEERAGIVANDLSIDLLIRDGAFLIDEVKQSYSINKDPELKNNENYLMMFLSYNTPWQTTAVLYKKSSIRNCWFDEKLKRFQDLSFNIRVLSQPKELKIHRDYKIDNYYRQDDEKVVKNNFIGNMYESFVVFHQVHINLFENKIYKGDFRRFNCKIIYQFVIPYFYQNRKASNRFLFWTVKSNIYSLSQKLTLIILLIVLNTSLYKIKGIGMYQLRNKIKSFAN
ncbi:glycosyltransferase family 2 protein [Flavobacterium ginsengisoli]|nr:glycosyltransferase family 2 protein [Flavobacterium ginsengisoli]